MKRLALLSIWLRAAISRWRDARRTNRNQLLKLWTTASALLAAQQTKPQPIGGLIWPRIICSFRRSSNRSASSERPPIAAWAGRPVRLRDYLPEYRDQWRRSGQCSGGLALKSATAQADFQMGISAVRTVLAAIETSIGGTPPAVRRRGVSQC